MQRAARSIALPADPKNVSELTTSKRHGASLHGASRRATPRALRGVSKRLQALVRTRGVVLVDERRGSAVERQEGVHGPEVRGCQGGGFYDTGPPTQPDLCFAAVTCSSSRLRGKLLVVYP